jgi:hypothetical protein
VTRLLHHHVLRHAVAHRLAHMSGTKTVAAHVLNMPEARTSCGLLHDVRHGSGIKTTATCDKTTLLDPQHQAIDQLRYQIVDDKLWPTALEIGANVNLGPLVGLSSGDVQVELLIGDVYVITEWARAMTNVGELVQEMRKFVGESDAAPLFQNSEFKKKRDALQQKLAEMVKTSKARFDEPWGMVCLFWAGGPPSTSYAKIASERLTLERGARSV